MHRSIANTARAGLLFGAWASLASCDSKGSSPLSYTIGVTVSGVTGSGLSLSDNGGDVLSVPANGSFTFATPVASGTTYSVTVFTEPAGPAQTCTAANDSGTVTSANVTSVTVTCGPSVSVGFVYAVTNASTTPAIWAYSIDATTGGLTPVAGSPFAATGLTSLDAITVDRSGAFVYAVNATPGRVAAYAINPATGALTKVPGSPYSAGSGSSSIAVSPNGSFAYVANASSNSVSAYTVNSGTGALAQVAGSPFASDSPGATGTRPNSLMVDPGGQFLYVANNLTNEGAGGFAPTGFGDVSVYAINSVTGTLASVPGSPFGAGDGATSISVDPSGPLVYVADPIDLALEGYTINSSTGALAGTGVTSAGGSPPGAIAFSPTGKFVYVPDLHSGNVLGFALNPTSGALASIPGSPFAGGYEPEYVTIDQSGRFIYVAGSNLGTIAAYSINATTGALAVVGGSPFLTAAGTGIAVAVYEK